MPIPRTTPQDFVFSNPRLAEIARMGAAVNAWGMADDDPPPSDPPEDPPADDPPADDPSKGDDGTDWRAESRKHEARAKRDKAAAEKAATEKKAADERLAAVLKAAGIGDDEDPAEKLKATAGERDTAVSERDAEKAARIAAERQTAAVHAAYTGGANVETLFDSSAFLRELDALGDEWTDEAVTGLITSTLKAKPQYKAAPAAPATPGAPGGEPKRNPDVAPGMARMRAAYGT